MTCRFDHCQVCGRRGYLQATISLLDGYQRMMCCSCFEHNAEPFKAIANYTRAERWKDMPLEVRSVLTVWIDERYVPALQGMKRFLHQQVIPCPPKPVDPLALPPEDEATLKRLMDKVKSVREIDDLPPRRGRFFEFLGSLFGWSYAS